jgi:hypothetical protein
MAKPTPEITLRNLTGKALYHLPNSTSIKQTVEAAANAGVSLAGVDLRGADLRCGYLSSADLNGADLQGADLQGVVMRATRLKGAILDDACLQGADLQDAFLQDASLLRADLAFVKLNWANFENALAFGGTRLGKRGQVKTASRSDGYIFSLWDCMDGKWRVQAGCRWFTLPEAWKHWTATRNNTPRGEETFDILVAFEHHITRLEAKGN